MEGEEWRKSSVEGCEEEEMEHMGKRVLSIMLGFWKSGKEELVGLWVEEGHIFHYTEGKKEEMSKYR